MALAGSIFLICAIPYLMLAYTFFLIPYLSYLFGKHTAQQKAIQTLALVIVPWLIPAAALVLIAARIIWVLGGITVIILFSIVSWLAWLNSLFPFGRVFRAWFRAAFWVLARIRRFLRQIGLAQFLFGGPLMRLPRISQT
jgi:hypothetical protein